MYESYFAISLQDTSYFIRLDRQLFCIRLDINYHWITCFYNFAILNTQFSCLLINAPICCSYKHARSNCTAVMAAYCSITKVHIGCCQLLHLLFFFLKHGPTLAIVTELWRLCPAHFAAY